MAIREHTGSWITFKRARRSKAQPGSDAHAADERSLEDVERAHVRRVLESCATLGEAAKRLGINAATLWRMRKRWGLP